jgi:hypothetical protein
MAVQRSVKITKEGEAKSVTLRQLREFVEETADLDPNLIPTAKVSTMASRLQELEVSGDKAPTE